jgi:DNA-binding beta-propeller fold protein YncE
MRNRRVGLSGKGTFVALVLASACGGSPPPEPAPPVAPPSPPAAASVEPQAPPPADTTPPAPPAPATLTGKSVPFPGATGPVSIDYIAYEAQASRVWVPVGTTGSVDVFDVATSTFKRVDGFRTIEREMRGKKRVMGPSAVAIGDTFAYVGNRATSEVCPVELATLKLGKCVKLANPTDGVAYVPSAKEVWVTTPKASSLVVLDASKPGALKVKTEIKVDGSPEGYAVDDAHGIFFTNLEDKDKTLAIDVASHKVKSTWSSSCGSDGPRGLASDSARGFVIVACTDHVEVLDAAHDGALLGKLDTGGGVDNIDYLASRGMLYAAAGKVANLTVAHVDDKGQLSVAATGATADGARNGVADANGGAYVPDSAGAALIAFGAPGGS